MIVLLVIRMRDTRSSPLSCSHNALQELTNVESEVGGVSLVNTLR
jgi:hypothetical protein